MRKIIETGIETSDVDGLLGPGFGGSHTTEVILTGSRREQSARWRPGERLHDLFEERCDRLRAAGESGRVAVDAGDLVLTYDQLDARANQLARHLSRQGVRPGDRVALLFDRALDSYVAMLAVLKVNSAYVPLDAGYPPDRLAYIVADAGVRTVLSVSSLRERVEHVDARLLCLDELERRVALEADHRLEPGERGTPVNELCYIVYTSGSTGRPKGVAIEHPAICNFVRVAGEVYGLRGSDRLYQGMTIAFDFSVEEIWVPWIVGATLVPKPGLTGLVGDDLRDFLLEREITALCCVPTLLATLEGDLPGLRFLLVSGEACPQDLIARWHHPQRRFLNVYGPTETTVTATWTPVHPDRRVTIGVPLPTYSAVILDPDAERALRKGEIGEIGIAGIGLSTGYVNRDDLTDRAFVRDFIGIPHNPSGRIYRTGDLGRIDQNGEIEYHGRIDTQVKIRGYRIELTEIESVLLQIPGIAAAVVDAYQPEPGVAELVAYYSRRTDSAHVEAEEVFERLRDRLPTYMIPAYFEELDAIPMLPSDKADRKNLPPPRGPRRGANAGRYAAPSTPTETVLAGALAGVLRLERVSATAHVFDDLGASSLLMARFCARVREQAGLPSLSMRDVYLHPTVRDLAAFADVAGATPRPAGPVAVRPADGEAVRVGTLRYVLCGAVQAGFFLAYTLLLGYTGATGFDWISEGDGFGQIYLRSAAFGSASFCVLALIPVLLKWVLIGRWRPREIPIWTLTYVRFWLVSTLIRFSPMMLFVGSPLYVLYLRALGARIGKGATILSQRPPTCTDLLTIGAGAVIRKDAYFTCYRAQAGRIQTGPVTIGKDAFVGEATVIDIGASIGDGAQLGHSSALHTGQVIPDGQCWHGSPAQPAEADYRTVGPATCGTARRAAYGASQLLYRLLVDLPVVMLGSTLVWRLFPATDSAIFGPARLPLGTWSFYRGELIASLLVFFGGALAGLALVMGLPRVLNLALRPDRVYPLYGVRYTLERTIARLTNLRFFMTLFGDSSYIVGYLRRLGYDLSKVQQTGSNFGLETKHETPYLTSIGTGTMVSDGLSVMNADFSSTSFRVTRVSIGERNFVGNNIAFPPGAKTGENCLLGTKVMIPISGEIRKDVGLLGSPPFEIPRSVRRDGRFDHLKTGQELRDRLTAKNRHNLLTMARFLFLRWLYLFALILVMSVSFDLDNVGDWVVAVGIVVTLALGVVLFALAERATMGFRAMRPQYCSIYEPYYWRHERFWKLSATVFVQMFNGTPFKSWIWRLLGVRVGRKVFDDGCSITEKSLVTIGDGCTLNMASLIQGHSLEDGTFKSDRITIGDGCTIGTGAFVHYGVEMGAGVVLDADSFLMKGEEIAAGERWQGNPARQRRQDARPIATVRTARTEAEMARLEAVPVGITPAPHDETRRKSPHSRAS